MFVQEDLPSLSITQKQDDAPPAFKVAEGAFVQILHCILALLPCP